LHTPNVKSIDELANFLKIKDKSRLAKSRVFVVPSKDLKEPLRFILALVCGDDEVNEQKLQTLFPGIRAAHEEELMEISGADAGSIGPVGLIKTHCNCRLEA
jgi:prolyl-tRNA synthetase